MNGSHSHRARELALKVGFDAVGFARAEPVDPETSRRVRDWLVAGHQASMAYLERHLEERCGIHALNIWGQPCSVI